MIWKKLHSNFFLCFQTNLITNVKEKWNIKLRLKVPFQNWMFISTNQQHLQLNKCTKIINQYWILLWIWTAKNANLNKALIWPFKKISSENEKRKVGEGLLLYIQHLNLWSPIFLLSLSSLTFQLTTRSGFLMNPVVGSSASILKHCI